MTFCIKQSPDGIFSHMKKEIKAFVSLHGSSKQTNLGSMAIRVWGIGPHVAVKAEENGASCPVGTPPPPTEKFRMKPAIWRIGFLSLQKAGVQIPKPPIKGNLIFC